MIRFFSSFLLLALLFLSGCPFDNPYQYYGQACPAEQACPAPLTCRGGLCLGALGCVEHNDCDPRFVCEQGECMLRGADASRSPDSGIVDAGDVDSQGLDAELADQSAPDHVVDDARAATDSATVDTVLIQDAQSLDFQALDSELEQDAQNLDAQSDDANAEQDAGISDLDQADSALPDGACRDAQDCLGDAQSCVAGYCMPTRCEDTNDCNSALSGFVCNLLTQSCVPTTCSTDRDCANLALACDVNNTCVPRKGQIYDACQVLTQGDRGGCSAGLDCFLPWADSASGICAPPCNNFGNDPESGGCTNNQICVPLGRNASVKLDGTGVCLERCISELFRPANTYQPALTCSVPDGGMYGVLYPVAAENFGQPCINQAECPGPFVCMEHGVFAGSSFDPVAGICTLRAEALALQARREGRFVLDEYQCPAGMVWTLDQYFDAESPSLCLPRCQSDEDCRLAVPAGATPQCYHHYPEQPFAGVCGAFFDVPMQTDQDQCWVTWFSPDINDICLPLPEMDEGNTETIDDDGDGILDGWDFSDIHDVTGGTGQPGQCRISDECQTGQLCFAGQCLDLQCRSDSCGEGFVAIGEGGYCPPEKRICLSQQQIHDFAGFPLCVDDADCVESRCIANVCRPSVEFCADDQPAHYGLCEWVPNFYCVDDADCMAGSLCGEDKRCHSDHQFAHQSCALSDDCPQGQVCYAGLCWEKPICQPEQQDFDSQSGVSACLDCRALVGPDAQWTYPDLADEANVCPCGMVQDNVQCFGSRSRCGLNQACPPNELCDSAQDLCVPAAASSSDLCPVGFADTGSACLACEDLLASPASWNFGCNVNGDLDCPCGFSCLIGDDSAGYCVPPAGDFACRAFSPESQFMPCGEEGLILDGICQSGFPRPTTDCNFCNATSELCLALANQRFCLPDSVLPSCDVTWAGCTLNNDRVRGHCAPLQDGVNKRCVPDTWYAQMQSQAMSELDFLCNDRADGEACGPDCLCHNGSAMPWLLSDACPANTIGLGQICISEDKVKVVDLPEGLPCTLLGQNPGRVQQRQAGGGDLFCVPSDLRPGPGCIESGRAQQCSLAQVCQLGRCVDQSPDPIAAQEGFMMVQPVGSPWFLQRLAPQAIAHCDPLSSRCIYQLPDGSRVSEGGVCLEQAGANGQDQCFPRVGCDLKAPGELCVDDAPVPAAALAGERCNPYSSEPCAMVKGHCAAGACKLREDGNGICLSPRACNHYYDCPSGDVCAGGFCKPVHSQFAEGSTCDARTADKHWISTPGLVFNHRCYPLEDPRCLGRAFGELCLGAEKFLSTGNQYRCVLGQSSQLCLNWTALPECSSTQGENCLDNSGDVVGSGACKPLPGSDSSRCVPSF